MPKVLERKVSEEKTPEPTPQHSDQKTAVVTPNIVAEK